jgi:hypothetical protein
MAMYQTINHSKTHGVDSSETERCIVKYSKIRLYSEVKLVVYNQASAFTILKLVIYNRRW